MRNPNPLTDTCQVIAQECTECGQCVQACLFLKETGETPAAIAQRGPLTSEAYSCTLCGLCETVCPESLSPRDMFLAARKEAVNRGQIDIDNYRYMFPDRKNNVMAFYRQYSNIDYDDLKPDKEASAAFFPGCAMLTYAPELVRAVFAHLQKSRPDLTLITDCCGIPLDQLGVSRRYRQFAGYLQRKLAGLKIKSLITACPSCYYQLPSVLSGSSIELLTVYEALELDSLIRHGTSSKNENPLITLHDSCPDRRLGTFAKQAREALKQMGYSVRELEHNREHTACCGSGGQISHFRQDLSQQLIERRWQEANDTEAKIFATYCVGCALNFAKKPGDKKVQHVLNLLLNVPQDFAGVKLKAAQIFEGPQGEKNWEKVMAD